MKVLVPIVFCLAICAGLPACAGGQTHSVQPNAAAGACSYWADRSRVNWGHPDTNQIALDYFCLTDAPEVQRGFTRSVHIFDSNGRLERRVPNICDEEARFRALIPEEQDLQFRTTGGDREIFNLSGARVFYYCGFGFSDGDPFAPGVTNWVPGVVLDLNTLVSTPTLIAFEPLSDVERGNVGFGRGRVSIDGFAYGYRRTSSDQPSSGGAYVAHIRPGGVSAAQIVRSINSERCENAATGLNRCGISFQESRSNDGRVLVNLPRTEPIVEQQRQPGRRFTIGRVSGSDLRTGPEATIPNMQFDNTVSFDGRWMFVHLNEYNGPAQDRYIVLDDQLEQVSTIPGGDAGWSGIATVLGSTPDRRYLIVVTSANRLIAFEPGASSRIVARYAVETLRWNSGEAVYVTNDNHILEVSRNSVRLMGQIATE